MVGEDGVKRLVLYRVDGPLRQVAFVDGLYPQDTWSGKHVTYTRHECTGAPWKSRCRATRRCSTSRTAGRRVGGKIIGQVLIDPVLTKQVLRVPLESKNGMCVVEFEVDRTAIPKVVTEGENPDPRAAGPPLQPVRLPAVRIAFDVSPFRTRGPGSARISEGRWRVSPRRPLASTRSSPSRRRARGGIRRFLPLSTASPSTSRFSSSPSRTSGARAGAASEAARRALPRPDRRAPLLRLDVSAQRAGVRATTVHDLVPLRHPDGFRAARAACTRRSTATRPHLRPRLRQLGVHGARRRRAARRPQDHVGWRCPGWTRSSRATARRQTSAGRTSSPWRRSSRARTSQRSSRPTRCSSRRPAAGGRRRRGMGRAARLDRPGSSGSVTWTTRSSPASIAAPPRSSTHRASRASGYR